MLVLVTQSILLEVMVFSMTAKECLAKLLSDARTIDFSGLDKLPKNKREVELRKTTERWLDWIDSVNKPEWETTYGEEE